MIGKILFNKKTALFSAGIYAISVLPIQYAHFYAVDTLLVFFIVLTLLRSVLFYQNPDIKNAIFVGIAFGLSLATKISSLPLIIPIIFALILDFLFIFLKRPHKPRHWFPHVSSLLKKITTKGALIFISTIITFSVLQPYAIIDFNEFIKQNLYQSQMTHNAYVFPYTLQYVGKIPYLYELKNIFLWGLGPIIFSLSIFGLLKILSTINSSTSTKKTEMLIIFVFSILYFIIVGRFAVGWMRYMLPLYPFLALFAGVALYEIIKHLSKFKNVFRFLLYCLISILILIWPLSFLSVYINKNSRLVATDWINENIPPGSFVAVEHWDDRLPMQSTNIYNFIELTLYDLPDDNLKWSNMNAKIEAADYIIIASNRLYVPLQRLADCEKYEKCYPQTANYYKNLFSENLGFKKVAEFTSYPKIPILGVEIHDDTADESFTVYDHPKIMIFKNEIVKTER
jgi:4-amino-4-deoxy-L-arabinose transferase-like glycosyltransferase